MLSRWPAKALLWTARSSTVLAGTLIQNGVEMMPLSGALALVPEALGGRRRCDLLHWKLDGCSR